MLELTKDQIQKVADKLNALADKKLSYEGFKAKVNEMGIMGSDEDIKAFKEQVKELVSKKGELSEMSEEELAQAVGGVNWKKAGKIAGITVSSLIGIGGIAYVIHRNKDKWFGKSDDEDQNSQRSSGQQDNIN